MDSDQNIFLEQEITENLAGLRLDQAIARLFSSYSRSQLQNWIKQGHVKIDHKVCTITKQKVMTGQKVEIQLTLKPVENWCAQKISLDIVHEDSDIIVVNKPAGLVVHPGAGNPDQTLVNALLHHQPSLATLPRAGIIHRLDKETSGLLIIVKTLPAHHAFTEALKNHHIKREYLALVKGTLISGGTVNAAMGRHPSHRIKMAVIPRGREAITHYRVLERFAVHTFIQVELETGRTHQIRVHMNHIHHPVVGDPLYGNHMIVPSKFSEAVKLALKEFRRQALHAFQLTFTHPLTQQKLQFQAPLPTDMQNLLNLLREE